MVSVDILLSRLEKIRTTGPGRWIARCPAHEDRAPSLSVRELEDGRVLIHCFAGCAVQNVLAAVGLEFANLFPDLPVGHAKPERQSFNPRDVLACIALETAVVAAAGGALLEGKPFSEEDRERLALAVTRLRAAVSLTEARHGR